LLNASGEKQAPCSGKATAMAPKKKQRVAPTRASDINQVHEINRSVAAFVETIWERRVPDVAAPAMDWPVCEGTVVCSLGIGNILPVGTFSAVCRVC